LKLIAVGNNLQRVAHC